MNIANAPKMGLRSLVALVAFLAVAGSSLLLNVPVSQAKSKLATLTSYNEGITGPGHCD